MIARPTFVATPVRATAARVADPFAVLQRQVGRLIDDYRAPDTFGSGRIGATDITEDATGYHIYIEVPGCSEKDITLNASNGVLGISGEKKSPVAETGHKTHVSTRSFGAFSEHFNLPEGVDEDKITARIKDGVLKVTLPRREPARPTERRIDIQPG
ncbi:Hsp20/alpha crystallin family protein [Komagataeibacter intermedius]|uniref:Heat-shock protein Hsp20 n=2 Tax=Komagataeibacter intermedius TaxID=66229 RepID=A0A0N0MES7_9PROT|nr:Hsp20/alpha crystallin family protein [Komagataeibacter intermedius]KPH86743.1 heat-shock protein Hsp20 [Komagataeibacter intermedius AF2]MCF3636990.1 Hsp20/alpha crystallin family protein [Komagataeibacter intermedius]GAN86617.1 heat shock protein Hsp20/HspA [Komagataeibacter intermedius TF2]GBQ75966.1 heat shock protein Hsp20 [Komagataeibacter intermedius NRIC 0521]